ncbi:hypothetical protein FKM82_005962 [Ascaphus truei]
MRRTAFPSPPPPPLPRSTFTHSRDPALVRLRRTAAALRGGRGRGAGRGEPELLPVLRAGDGGEPRGGRGGHQQLEEWMGNMNFTAEVMWALLLLIPISPHLFLAPAFSSLFPLLPGRDLQALNCSWPDKKRIPGLGDVELPSLPPELQLHIRRLNRLMEGIGVREECFSWGT